MGKVRSVTSMRMFVENIVEAEVNVCIKEGDVREITMEGQRVIVIRERGQIKAFREGLK